MIQYDAIWYDTMQYNTIQYNTIQYNTIQYNAMQCNFMICFHGYRNLSSDITAYQYFKIVRYRAYYHGVLHIILHQDPSVSVWLYVLYAQRNKA